MQWVIAGIFALVGVAPMIGVIQGLVEKPIMIFPTALVPLGVATIYLHARSQR